MHFEFSRLECEQSRVVSSAEAGRRLQQMKDSQLDVTLNTVTTWHDARQWLDRTGPYTREADILLRPILAASKPQSDELWHDILLFLLWTPLRDMWVGLRLLDRDLLALYEQIAWAFLAALHRIDLSHRTVQIGQKILNDTQHDVRLAYARERKRGSWHVNDASAMNDGEDEGILGRQAANGVDLAWAEWRIDRAWACARLRTLLCRGQLSVGEYAILVRCCLRGDSVEDLTVWRGLTYEAAKRRRQRALAALKKSAPDLSPGSPDTPLRTVEPVRKRRL